MEQKKTIIVDDNWCSHHLLIEYHRGNIYFDKKIVEADIIDGVIKEWWVDNATRYSFNRLKDAKTFRGHIANSNEAFYLISSNPKDKTIVVFTNELEWWQLLLKDKELYCKKVKTNSNEFELIFKVLYSSKYKDYIKLPLSKDISITKRMKIIAKYLNLK